MEFLSGYKVSTDMSLDMFNLIKGYNPTTIVELGNGPGALHIAMRYAIHAQAKIYSYELDSSRTSFLQKQLNVRGMSADQSILTVGDVFKTFIANPFIFDLLIIDIDNTWERIYEVAIKNEFIFNQIKNGANVIIEGGAKAHPRINENTLNKFNASFETPVFAYKHITGVRTSFSKLELL